MALWGNKDDKTSTGTVQVHANGDVAGTSTLFDSENIDELSSSRKSCLNQCIP